MSGADRGGHEVAGLWVRDVGEGDPVVLVHPGPGLDGSVFFPGAERLAAAGHRVLAFDLPGNGRSPDGDRDDWTLAGYAAAVQRTAEALRLERWTLLGHSFGGYVAMFHLTAHPGTAARYIASCTDADEDPPPGAHDEEWTGLAPEVRAAVEAASEQESSVATPEACRAVWLAQLPFFADAPERVAPMLDGVKFRPAVHHPRDWGELHALDALAATDVPVLAIGGGRDRPLPPPAARRIADTARHGELLLLEDAGHFPFAEDPARYWDAVADWLARTAP